jgi:hypothetical protein
MLVYIGSNYLGLIVFFHMTGAHTECTRIYYAMNAVNTKHIILIVPFVVSRLILLYIVHIVHSSVSVYFIAYEVNSYYL